VRRSTSSTIRGKLGRLLLVVAFAVSLGFAAVWGLIALAGRQDRFRFLRGHSPFLSGVFPIIQDSGYQSKGFTDEYRVYSWREDFSQVCNAADEELARQGYTRNRTPYPAVSSWRRSDGFGVWIEAKHLKSREDLIHDRAPTDFAWVAVVCTDPIPDTWISHARYAMEPSDR